MFIIEVACYVEDGNLRFWGIRLPKLCPFFLAWIGDFHDKLEGEQLGFLYTKSCESHQSYE